MRTRSVSTIFLLVIVVILASIYWIGFKDKKPTPDASPTSSETFKVVTIQNSDISQIQWTYNSVKGTLEKVSESDWKLVDPPVVADKAKIDTLVSDVVNLTGESKYSYLEVSKADMGLDSPSATVTVRTKDGKTLKILIGKTSFDGLSYYVALDSWDYATLVPSYTIDSVKVDPYTLSSNSSPSPGMAP